MIIRDNRKLKTENKEVINVKYSFKNTNNTAQNALEKYLLFLQENIE